jgi:RND family efflux transporter MFP subunit
MARKRAPLKTLVVIGAGVIAVAAGARWVAMRPVPVSTVAATKGTAIDAAYATATVESSERVTVRSRVAGTVTQILAHEGDTVKQGQLLARLDAPDLEADLERSAGDLSAAHAEVTAIEAELRTAREDQSRTSTLAKSASISQAEANRASNGVDVLDARLAAANAKATALENQIRSRSSVGSRGEVRDLEVRSPLDGVVLKREATQGDVVPARSPIFDVAELKELLVECVVDEADLGRITSGTRAVVTFRALPDKTYEGGVVEIARDANREKKSFIVKVRVDAMPVEVRTGMSAEVNIILAKHENVILVAPGSVDGDGVWIVRDGTAHRVPVEVGVRSPSAVEVTRGVAQGDPVILNFDHLHEGARVLATPIVWSWDATH